MNFELLILSNLTIYEVCKELYINCQIEYPTKGNIFYE